MTDDRASVVKELAGAVSAQAQVSNRSWIALITVAVIASLPRRQPAEMTLPFSLGTIDPNWFHFVMFALLVVLTIGFASAHAQQVRAQRLAQSALKNLGEDSVLGVGIHPRDFFDALRLPSVNRVAPLAQLFKGLDAFFGSPATVPKWRLRASAAYYLLLKAASWLVYFGFPAVALWLSFARIHVGGWRWWGLCAAGSVASLALLHVFVVDVWYVREVKGIIADSRRPHNRPLQPTSGARGDRRESERM